ncbi:ankyrin repeat-containing protein [Chlorella sorokiniana]|uniref:Ankyrin repeat-containing protein n=1 Tax=Chlorella sorokiniana TaxID=3076 RepID=A0A2P6TXD4_CHLSO|nr:ankyrin repeat-containing protein [Chlorella sorokiniana]|eukprot:PRW58720.1 ankyrin repeat-containing protein [Chlorella sorokiniana]
MALLGRDWRGVKATLGEHAVHSLKPQLLADYVADLLSVKHALDSQVPLDSLVLRTRRSDNGSLQPSPGAAAAAAGVQLTTLTKQLQACVLWLQRPSVAGIPPVTAVHTADAVANLMLCAAAAGGHVAAARLVMLLSHSAATTRLGGQLPIHMAASGCHLDCLQALLEAWPATALSTDRHNCLPLHRAAAASQGGERRHHGEAVHLLLAAAPQTVTAMTAQNELALHLAATASRWSKSTDAVEALLSAAPQPGGAAAAAAATDSHGRVALHYAAAAGHLPTLELLLQVAPSTAAAEDEGGDYPLHAAAAAGLPDAVRLLMAAAPEAITAPGRTGLTPIELALGNNTLQHTTGAQRQAAARLLLAAAPAADLLPALQRAGRERGWALIPNAVALHLPLSDDEWDLVPYNLPGLGAALPAALAHSREQTRQLMRHLPRSDLFRLRIGALCLGRAQRRTEMALPPPILQQMLCLSIA